MNPVADPISTTQAGTCSFYRLPVTTNLYGQEVYIPLHVIAGKRPGPTVLLQAAVHGNETPPMRALKAIREQVSPDGLFGRLLLVPVANPLAFAGDSRNSPEMDQDFTNLNRVMPGRRTRPAFGDGVSAGTDRTFTEMIAATLCEEIYPHIDALIDYHCHAEGCCLNEVITHKAEGELGSRCLEMALAFGNGIVHVDNIIPGTTSSLLMPKGVPSIAPEIGGNVLGDRVEAESVRQQVEGALRVLAFLGSIPAASAPALPEGFEALAYHQCPKVRPTRSGYLVSRITPEELVFAPQPGIEVHEGDVLGTVFDPYSLEDVEQLLCPADGLLYLSRRSGPVAAGAIAFGVAAYADSRWLRPTNTHGRTI